MKYRLKASAFAPLSHILFFFTVVDNKYMEYSYVLVAVYILRFMYALRGYWLILSSLKKTKKTAYSKLLLLQLIFAAVITASDIINGTGTFGIVYSAFVWIGITNYIINSLNTDMNFLKTIDMLFKLLVITTLLLTAFLPDTVMTYSYDGTRIVEGFFGGKNALPMYLLTGLCINLLVYELEGRKKLWRRFIYPIICALFLFVSGSGTGLVTAAVFLVLFYSGIYKFLNTLNIFITEIIVTFSVVVFRVQERLLYPLIVDVLHRDITLTYRTDIWTIAINYFLKNWFLGYGLGNNVIADNLALPDWYRFTINETHNGFLDVALSLGIMGLIPFLIFLFGIMKEYDKSKNKPAAQVMKLYVFAYFVIAVTENAFTLSRLTFWSMLFLGLAVISGLKGVAFEEKKSRLYYQFRKASMRGIKVGINEQD